MHVDEADTPLLKRWIVKRLEDISDADSDVLADYVLALVKSDDPDDQVRATSLESLEDFLKDHTTTFVDDILQTIRTKSYDPNHTQASIEPPTGPSFNPPSGPSADFGRRTSLPGQGSQNGAQNGQSRKRNFNQTGLNDGQDSHYSRGSGDRAVKQMRRGGARGGIVPTGPAIGNGRGGPKDSSMGGMGNMSRPPMGPAGSLPSLPTPPPGFPPLDPNNPLAAMMAMQAMGFQMPGFPNLPGSPGFGQSSSPTSSMPPKKVGQRCRDYDTKGFCALGTACPYEHGFDSIVVGQTEEYDPTKASPTNDRPQNGYGHERGRGGDRGRGRGRGRGDRGGPSGKQRAPFSHAGPNHDKSNTTIVVEQIPEDKFDEQIVREFFSEFGNIAEIKMQAYKHLAIVQYDDYWAARKAYDSPKVIFDNRFVKVYWYKPDTVPTQPANGGHKADAAESKPDEEMIDPAEFEKKQAGAQKAHEEKQKRMEEAKNARDELDKKLKAQAEERRKLLEKLAAKTGGKDASPSTAQSPAAGADQDDTKKSQTESLRAKLAELEAEAERIGLNPDEQQNTGYRGRGRGGYRARGGFPPRGRGYDAFRGAPYRGRGGFGGASRGGVMRLDNRPKRVAVSGADLTSPEKDEAFRQYLFNNFEFDNIEAHPDKKDSVVVAFKERYLAENFINSASDIPQVGHVELAWHIGPPSTLPTSTASSTGKDIAKVQDTAMGGDINGAATAGEEAIKAEVDYDVADDEDQWMGS